MTEIPSKASQFWLNLHTVAVWGGQKSKTEDDFSVMTQVSRSQTQEFQGAMANLPQPCLRDPSPSKSTTEATGITKGNFIAKSIEVSPLPINPMLISHFTSRFQTSLAGEDRVCTLSFQLTWAKILANNETVSSAHNNLVVLCWYCEGVKKPLLVCCFDHQNKWLVRAKCLTNTVFIAHLLGRKAGKFRYLDKCLNC